MTDEMDWGRPPDDWKLEIALPSGRNPDCHVYDVGDEQPNVSLFWLEDERWCLGIYGKQSETEVELTIAELGMVRDWVDRQLEEFKRRAS